MLNPQNQINLIRDGKVQRWLEPVVKRCENLKKRSSMQGVLILDVLSACKLSLLFASDSCGKLFHSIITSKTIKHYDTSIVVQAHRGQGKANILISRSHINYWWGYCSSIRLKTGLKHLEMKISLSTEDIPNEELILYSVISILNRDIENIFFNISNFVFQISNEKYPSSDDISRAASFHSLSSLRWMHYLVVGRKTPPKCSCTKWYTIRRDAEVHGNCRI